MSESAVPVLPLDIVHYIVDILVNDAEGLQYVKAVSLTCKAFLPFCRKHIFSSIEIRTDNLWPTIRRPTAEALLQLLETPAIAKYVRHLSICTAFRPVNESQTLAQVAQQLTRIQSLSIWFHCQATGSIYWDDIALSTRRSLLTLMHLPTLNRLGLQWIKNFPISNLITCTNLKHLLVRDIHIGGDEHDGIAFSLSHKPVQLQSLDIEIRGSQTPTLLAAKCPNGQPAIDFTGLEKLSIVFDRDWKNAGIPTREIFRKAQRLVDISLQVVDILFRTLELAKMVTPSLQTLRRLTLRLSIESDSPDPLAVICDELEQISGGNNLESIDIQIEFELDQDCRTAAWGRLERALHPSGWPMLKHISLTILLYISSELRIDGPFGMALKSLPQTQFTDFTSRKDLDFQFSVKEYLL